MVALRKLLVVIASVTTCVAIAVPVLAISNPDIGPTINAVYAFQNVAMAGDMLFFIDENIFYNTLPSENAYSAYYLNFIDEDAVTIIASKRIFPFYNYGYGRGIIGFYFNASTCTANTMIWSDAFVFSLEGDPALSWDVAAPSDTSYVTTWSTYTSMALVREEVSELVINFAQTLDGVWGYGGTVNTLLSSTSDGLKLSDIGEAYFTGVLPGLSGIAQDAYGTSVTNPDIHKRVYGSGGATALTGQLTGTPFDLTGVATSMGLTLGCLNSILVLVVVVAIDYFMVRKQMSHKGIVMIDCFVFLLAAIMGILPLLIVLGGAVLCILAVVNVFFWSKSGA